MENTPVTEDWQRVSALDSVYLQEEEEELWWEEEEGRIIIEIDSDGVFEEQLKKEENEYRKIC